MKCLSEEAFHKIGEDESENEIEEVDRLEEIKALKIGYRYRIGRGFFISDIGCQERYRGYARKSGVHIRHYI